MEDFGTFWETGSFPMPDMRALCPLAFPVRKQKVDTVLEGPPGFGFLPGSPTDRMAGVFLRHVRLGDTPV